MEYIKKKILVYGRMIKFSHTIFALPFALSAVVMAWEHNVPSISDLFWILTAMVGARSAAMGFNRIVDADIDLKNQRTAIREIPSGLLSKKEGFLFVAFFSLVFIFSAAMLSRLCFILSFPVLFFFIFLFLYQAVYKILSSLPWICHQSCPPRRLGGHYGDLVMEYCFFKPFPYDLYCRV